MFLTLTSMLGFIIDTEMLQIHRNPTLNWSSEAAKPWVKAWCHHIPYLKVIFYLPTHCGRSTVLGTLALGDP